MTATEWGVITGISVSHVRATVDEITAARARSQRARVADLLARPDVSEAFALQTCNRSEAFVVTDDPETGRQALSEVAPSVREGAVRYLRHEDSLRHVMAVASGLRSLVLGEDQVLGQVRDAYHDADEVGGVGPVLEEAIPKAIHVGTQARADTAINDGHTSVGTAAVELAAEELTLGSARALVVGAGEMGALAARSFADYGVDELMIANRTIDRAEQVASLLQSDISATIQTTALDRVPEQLPQIDVVVSATGSDQPVLTPSTFEGVRSDLVVLDLAQPRDVAPAVTDWPELSVYDLDDLEAIADRTHQTRQAAANEVRSLIDAELDHLLARYKRKRADDVIAAMYEGAEGIKRQELERAFSKLEANGDLSDAQREIIESMADALVNKLLATPTDSLREAAEHDDWTTIHTALELFDPHSTPQPDSSRQSVPAQDD